MRQLPRSNRLVTFGGGRRSFEGRISGGGESAMRICYASRGSVSYPWHEGRRGLQLPPPEVQAPLPDGDIDYRFAVTTMVAATGQ